MLLTEIHGKRCQETRGNEDYLTSTVFGHLRLIAPSVFWNQLFRHGQSAAGKTLYDKLALHGIAVAGYTRLNVSFWSVLFENDPDHLSLSDAAQRSLVLIEAKPNTEKLAGSAIPSFAKTDEEPESENFPALLSG